MSRVAPIAAESRSRFVLLCQQTLALALVTAVLAPAAQVMTLDIVAPPHHTPTVAVSPSGAAARR